MGAKSMYKATAEDTRGAYSLAIETTPPHSGLPLHIHHREDEAMYILEGEYEIQCGDRTIRATKGTFVFLPRGIPNRFENVRMHLAAISTSPRQVASKRSWNR